MSMADRATDCRPINVVEGNLRNIFDQLSKCTETAQIQLCDDKSCIFFSRFFCINIPSFGSDDDYS